MVWALRLDLRGEGKWGIKEAKDGETLTNTIQTLLEIFLFSLFFFVCLFLAICTGNSQ